LDQAAGMPPVTDMGIRIRLPPSAFRLLQSVIRYPLSVLRPPQSAFRYPHSAIFMVIALLSLAMIWKPIFHLIPGNIGKIKRSPLFLYILRDKHDKVVCGLMPIR